MHLPFDPDFDQPQKSFWSSLSPKAAFWAGAMLAALGLGTAGFIALLSFLL